jgi:hypothetical protein
MTETTKKARKRKLSLANQVDTPPPSGMGGPTQESFGYDDLYRLTNAAGSFKNARKAQW